MTLQSKFWRMRARTLMHFDSSDFEIHDLWYRCSFCVWGRYYPDHMPKDGVSLSIHCLDFNLETFEYRHAHIESLFHMWIKCLKDHPLLSLFLCCGWIYSKLWCTCYFASFKFISIYQGDSSLHGSFLRQLSWKFSQVPVEILWDPSFSQLLYELHVS